MPVPSSFDVTETIRALAEQLDALAQALEALVLRVGKLEAETPREAKVKKVTT